MADRPVRAFDGVDDRIGLTAGALVAEPPLTVGVVCKRTGTPSGQQFMLALSRIGFDTYVAQGFTEPGNPGDYLQFQWHWADSPDVELAAADGWAICFASYDYDGTIRVSRKLLSGGSWLHGNGWGAAEDTYSHVVDAVYLGCYHGVSNFFSGHIAAAAVWDRVLTDADRNAVSLDGSDGWLASNPVALWDLGQATVDEGVVDLTLNGANEAELDGTSVVVEDVPWSLPSPPPAEKISVLTSSGWHELAGPAGPPGSPGPRGLKGDRGDVLWRGVWTAGDVYAQGDAVGFEGASYVARETVTGAGQSPTAHPDGWDLLAAQGEQGIPGTFLGVQEDHSTLANVYSPNLAAQHNVQKSDGVLMTIAYTPPVNAWWEILGHVGTLQKVDAAYHYASLSLMVTPAPVGFPAGGATAVSADNLTQHATVQTFEAREAKRTVALVGGTLYQAYLIIGPSGGTWRYLRSQTQLWIEGKAWAR